MTGNPPVAADRSLRLVPGLLQQGFYSLVVSMGRAAPKPCGHPACPALVFDGGWCEKHRLAAWSQPTKQATPRITGRRLQRLRTELFAREPLCVGCLKRGKVQLATQRDHVVPLFEGGADDESNTQGLCDDCHDTKSEDERLRAQGRGGSKVWR